MNTKKLLFITFSVCSLYSCTTSKVSQSISDKKVKEGQGFYQFLTDDPNASPFFAKKESVYGTNGMVAATHPIASNVGVDILKAGGNAIDAAVAVNFALAVCHPAAGNIGGGGFLVYRDKKGENYTLDYREKAPETASRDMYLDAQGNVIQGLSFVGHLASGVPGTVDGMVEMHKKFGKLSWEKVLQPAIDLAGNGVKLTAREARGMNRIKDDLLKYNPGKRYFLKSDNTEWQEGDIMIQKDLAKTLQRIQEKGRAGFYEGENARLLLEEMSRGKGIITQKDLDNYKAQWRKPLVDNYKNYKVIGMPPPSSGGVALIQLLKLVEPYPLSKWGWHSDSATQVMIEAERRVYADRAKWLGDPDFVKVPVGEITNKNYLENRWKNFSFAKASDSKEIAGGAVPGYESTETTHFSVVDKEGNAVAITTTLNNSYGNRVVVDGAGFFMNDEMDDFSVKPGVPNAYGLIGTEANSIRPNKRMLSSMTPTIIEKDGKLLMVVGTPGGSTIITSVFQVIINVLEHNMTMQQSVDALRFHHQWLPDRTVFEQGAFTEKTIKKLQERGYNLEMQKNTIGRMDCILVLPNGKLEGGADVRSDDTAVGF
ncbi:gamma-glutamyltranspeptidase / glutathione hydrolase [Pseudarcicella hirudinis]|uniref:Glutathione hydrolase proenzyme n=1 Tax=Pseudarcicella hirudinis TaxID=1079859 RepID=A0A1I5VCW2_9BACT|nr:gamma-glutamyltransferase [Pseudarcicella hirudinis]SFQ04756.1 gamma-glutamyltranspeptidase / glutathione hydrolase [Pseudarcicella hirudinis]